MQQLTLELVACIPHLGCFNLMRAKTFPNLLDTPMRIDQAAPLSSLETAVNCGSSTHAATQRERERSVPETFLVAARRGARDIMEVHQFLGHASEDITRGTAQIARVKLTGAWIPCVQCSEANVRRYAVPKTTDSQAIKRAGRFLVGITDPSTRPRLRTAYPRCCSLITSYNSRWFTP